MPSLDHKYPAENRQQAFVDHGNGTLVALSGPGTGKTTSLIQRIATLVKQRGIPAEHICYLTFIKAIAKAFKSDLYQRYDNAAEIDHLRISTLHSLASRIVRNMGYAHGLDGTLYTLNYADDSDPISGIVQADFLRLCENISGAPELRHHLLRIKTAWQKVKAIVPYNKNTIPVQNLYSQYSRSMKVLDWDELVPIASDLYSSAQNLPTWLESLNHLLIDEYQDFNPAEQGFLSLLIGKSESNVLVGDPDQSIYRGRSASPDGIIALTQEPLNSTVSLVICRRCGKNIIDAANAFLSFMKPHPQLLQPFKKGGSIHVMRFVSCKAESDYLASRLQEIQRTTTADSKPEERPICLFPNKKVLRQYLTEFEKRGIPCCIREGTNQFDSREWLKVYARLIINRDNKFLQRILIEHFPALRRKLPPILRIIVNENKSIADALHTLSTQPRWGRTTETDKQRYLNLLDALSSRDADRILPHLNELLAPDRHCLAESLQTFLLQVTESNVEEPIDLLVSTVFPSELPEQDQIAIELTTMHGSKGLTRKWVFLPGMEQAWLPADAQGERLEESKRLFYIALTRATDEVCITYPGTRAKGDILNYPTQGRGQKSSFLDQIGVREHWKKN